MEPTSFALTMRSNARLEIGPSGCWLWTGARTANGYAVIKEAGRVVYGHRLALELLRGCPIPAGLVVDHRCGNRRCVNPDHLEAVSSAENNLRAWSVGAQRKVRLARLFCEGRQLDLQLTATIAA